MPGAPLWQFRANARWHASPMTYVFDGKQYIAVAAGGNAPIDFKRGNNIIAFTVD